MDINGWKDIFKLLAMVILADERVYKEEVDTFVDSIMVIKASVDDDTLITRDLAFEWFRGNRAEIAELAKTDEFQVHALRLIMSLKGFEYRKAVLRAMLAVSISDNEFHASEESLVHIACAHWGIKFSALGPKGTR